jgi:hypothetical protein
MGEGVSSLRYKKNCFLLDGLVGHSWRSVLRWSMLSRFPASQVALIGSKQASELLLGQTEPFPLSS